MLPRGNHHSVIGIHAGEGILDLIMGEIPGEQKKELFFMIQAGLKSVIGGKSDRIILVNSRALK